MFGCQVFYYNEGFNQIGADRVHKIYGFWHFFGFIYWGSIKRISFILFITLRKGVRQLYDIGAILIH